MKQTNYKNKKTIKKEWKQMKQGKTRKGKYSKIILKEKKFPKMNKPNKE
jgi:hypothetical protein